MQGNKQESKKGDARRKQGRKDGGRRQAGSQNPVRMEAHGGFEEGRSHGKGW